MCSGWDVFSRKTFLDVNRDLKDIAKSWKRRGFRRVLDMGCGNGRHLRFLARKGFEVYGIDVSRGAIRLARNLLRTEGLKAKLRVCNFFRRIPYPDEFFDAIVCTRSLNHGKIEDIRKAIREMYRLVRKGVYAFITVHKHKGKKKIPKERLYGIKWVAPRTYVILGGPEKGILHYRFNKKILIKEFRSAGFVVEGFWINEEGYYSMVVRKK